MTSLEELYSEVRIGDVVNFDSTAAWYNLPMRFFFAELHRAQRKKFPGSQRVSDVHSVLVLNHKSDSTPLVLSVTVPVAVIEPLTIGKRTQKVTVCRPKREGAVLPQSFINEMRRLADELLGTGYDYGQILKIKLKLQGWPSWIANWFDLSEKRTVCSGGAQYCLLGAWEKFGAMLGVTQPLGGIDPNGAYPAHFPNHPSFDIVWEKKL